MVRSASFPHAAEHSCWRWAGSGSFGSLSMQFGAEVGPQLVISDGGRAARFHWKVVVNDQTDENGWQYASGFSSSNWMRSFDTLGSWV
eukprot:3765811-Amphidinium_carterae.1